MPPIAAGINKRVGYKKETTWGVLAGAAGGQLLRRVTSDLALKKADYKSAEIRADYQVVDYRHGMRSIEGRLRGELSAGTWKDFLAAAVRQAFTTVTAIAGLTITIAASGANWTLTRSAGSWITDGIKLGDVGKFTAGVFNAANTGKNLFVLAESALVLTVTPLNGVALVAEGPIAAATFTFPGKKTFIPSSAFTDDSFTIEHWFSDIAQSEQFSGCKIQQLDIALPPSGMGTIDLQFIGKDMTPGTAQYFTTPTAETTSGILAAVNGVVAVQGSPIALLTGLQLSLKANMTADPIVGSNVYTDITEGRMEVDGQFSVLFQDATVRDYFVNETEISLYAALSASPSAAADFLGIGLPRIKVGAATRDDGEKGLTLTCPFTALRNSAGGAGTTSEDTTLRFQDSQA